MDEKQKMNVIQLIAAALAAVMLAAVCFLLSFVMSSCSAVGEDTGEGPQGRGNAGGTGSAIAFTADTGGTSPAVSDGDGTARTRTAPGTMTLDGSGSTESLQAKGFGVFACHTGVHPYVSTSTTANLMWNQLVGYNGSTGQWEYAPLVYWPNFDEGVEEYVTFFAYAPHSTNAQHCIADMSRPDETGDPWILYQLGGSEEAGGDGGGQSQQVDLLYDFRKDLRRDRNVNTRVDLTFRHALACAGDQVAVTAGPRLQRLLMRYAASMGGDVTLTLRTLTLDYLLTRKGRLVLNSATQPNWQAVESEDAKVHRYLRLSPGHRLAVSSASACTVTDYSVSGQGVFYIPVETGDERQQVTATATWQLTNGDEGEVSTSVDLSMVSDYSRSNGLRFTLELPEPECTGVALSRATVGMVVCSHGKAHAATTGALSCEGRKVAVVAYVGDGDSSDGTYNHGLAIALSDAGRAQWCGQEDEACLGSQPGSESAALSLCDGLAATAALLSAGDGHSHDAARLAADYRYDASVGAGSHPAGTSRWFLPSMGQWCLMAKAMTGRSSALSSSENGDYLAAVFNPLITAAGGTGVRGAANELYWSSTESSRQNAWYMSFEKGKTSKDDKTTLYYVRPVLAY